MSELSQECQEHIKKLHEAGYAIVPEDLELSDPDGALGSYCYDFSIPRDTPIKCNSSHPWDSESRQRDKGKVSGLNLSGGFGEEEGFAIDNFSSFTEEEILSLIPPSEENLKDLSKLEDLRTAIETAAKAYKKFGKDKSLWAEVEFSTDPSTIIEWNSSHC